MRIAFMGTPAFAVPTLARLLADGHEVVAVYTQPPRPAGRGKGMRPSAVETFAREAGLSVRTPTSLKGEAEIEAWRALGLDAAVVAAFGLILPRSILDAPCLFCLNVHASLLPRWRGAAPIQRAILAGDARTGVTIMDMEAGLDTGPMRLVRETPVAAKTAGELTNELAELGAAMMSEVLADPARFAPVPQPDEGVTYAPKINKVEARLDFAETAGEVERRVRAFAPAPGAWFEHGGERIRVLTAELAPGEGPPGKVLDRSLRIACAGGAVRPLLVQRAGRGVIAASELLRGFAIPAGTVLA